MACPPDDRDGNSGDPGDEDRGSAPTLLDQRTTDVRSPPPAGSDKSAPATERQDVPGALAQTALGQPAKGAVVPPTQVKTGTHAVETGALDLDQLAATGAFVDRYRGGKLLGEGGMGEVRQYNDQRIGRNVAIKFLRPTPSGDDESVARFVREARVQGQLQHPSVVPVYDLGVGANGRPFFTMKRLGGNDLHMTLRDQARSKTPRDHRALRRLLTAFSDVCLAVDYAHSRGVIHRDLKPANIMLGDFGEVYVLDWGLARLADKDDDIDLPGPDDAADSGKIESAKGLTSKKQVMGTAGYMSPEQLRGKPLDGRVDVYALGAILFEILMLQPLHRGDTATELADATLLMHADDLSRRTRKAGIAPELEAICIDATAKDPNARIATARELNDRLERYLAGDRDLLRRKEMADEYASEATRSAILAISGDDSATRKKAMGLATRALALDPDHNAAAQTMLQLLLEPPKTPPPEFLEDLRVHRLEKARGTSRLAVVGYLSWLIAVPMFIWMGVRDWSMGAVLIGAVLACAAVGVVYNLRGRIGGPLLVIGVLVNAVALFLISRLFGPLVLVPTLAVSTSVGFALYGHRLAGALAPVAACAAIIAAVVAEAAGWLPSSYHFTGGGLTLRSAVLELPPVATTVTLTSLLAAAVLVISAIIAKVRRNLETTEERLLLLLWQYRQLAPDAGDLYDLPSVAATRPAR